MYLGTVILLVSLATSAFAATTCNVLDYGGVADNSTDIAPAITSAYNDCVAGATTSDATDTVLLVPSGTYALVTAVTLTNVADFSIEINGDLNLIFNASLSGTLFSFDDCNNMLTSALQVVWQGTGTIYGHGDLWRPDENLMACTIPSAWPNRPRLVRFQTCNNIDMSGVTLNNSPMFHVTIIGDNNVAHDMQIIADHIGETDGFDMSGNNNYVHDVSVENGDECVTVKAPTNGFVGENIQCFYSAGCNIGSFGNDATGISVQNVYYKNVTQQNGDGGIVLKSYPTASGLVTNATYVDFTFTNIAYPLQVDSFWCPNEACPATTGNITWTDITFENISGTGDNSTRPTIMIDCIAGYECTGMTFENVDLGKEGGATVEIEVTNACGTGLSQLSAC
ncbi:glycoside hydrolase family 28 protein [Serpula lacrymans var. lacrymans S7.3]|uniref:Glycoside hydrolase family 28 protein n=2 Tax=Serpula lacrymans var. lacrymans TaxID=341189 RepID=F8Q1D3_SERL3|nr:glycoside hydrolase family 28 protein [Serpula lacrymans var. lacrymans S7.9]EGN98111.1 glycoside hydrolase family 28 protein [Serpula lacrymans var. lacrymans S7.3]EGO23694.1 glycoside hydrolase family 28 protein [Serpula lacrymans var. lacrymans S7.9]